jgi:hypothetical protein
MINEISNLFSNDKKIYVYGDQKYPSAILEQKENKICSNMFADLDSYNNYLLKVYKQNSTKIYFLSYGNHKFTSSIQRIRLEAENLKIFDKVICLTDKNLEPDFLEQHGKFIQENERGGGYWIWKPYIVKRILEQMNENDILVYVDSGCKLNIEGLERFKEYFDIVTKSPYGSLAFELPYIEKNWTKGDIFSYFNVVNDKKITHSWQLMATTFILRKCDHTMKMINEWNEVMSHYELIDDSPSVQKNSKDFIENRHDQSIFSIIRKKHGTEIITDETCYPFLWENFVDYPIHSMRIRM